MTLNLHSELLQVLNDRAINRLAKVGVVVGHDACLVTDAVVYVLHAALTEELVASTEGHLDDGAELCELFRGIVLNVSDALIVSERQTTSL